MTGILLRDSSESGIAAGIGRMGHKNGSSNRSRMKKLWMLLLAAICGSCSIPPEDENRHYSIWIANNSQNAIFVDFSWNYFKYVHDKIYNRTIENLRVGGFQDLEI